VHSLDKVRVHTRVVEKVCETTHSIMEDVHGIVKGVGEMDFNDLFLVLRPRLRDAFKTIKDLDDVVREVTSRVSGIHVVRLDGGGEVSQCPEGVDTGNVVGDVGSGRKPTIPVCLSVQV
jgi:hypothetical protein